MGCFSPCFGKSKRQRRSQRRPFKTAPCLLDHLQKHESVEDFQVGHLIDDDEENIERPIDDPSLESKIDETKEKANLSGGKKVLLESKIDETKEKANLSGRKKVTFDLNVRIYEQLPTEEEEVELEGEEESVKAKNKEGKGSEPQSPSDSSSSSLFSYPPSHRYQNCRDSDDEFDEVLSSDESELDNDDDEDYDYDYDYGDEVESEVKNDEKPMMAAEDHQSSESLFSLSIDSRKQQSLRAEETGDNKEVNSPIPVKNRHSMESNRNPQYDESKYVDSVLNPVENVAQWKVMKARSRRAIKDHGEQAKENNVLGQDLNFAVKKEPLQKEIGVDTSLSSWLVGSEAATTTPNSKTTSSVSVGNSASDRSKTTSITSSPRKFDDRPILGALTIEEIRQFSATSSPRRSPRLCPDDMPIIGSVGSYWSHTGQNSSSGSSTRSKSRFTESTEVIWDSTPFEKRLEKALEKEGTAADR